MNLNEYRRGEGGGGGLAVLGVVAFVGVMLLSLVALGMWGCPTYNVWQQRLVGEAELSRATMSRRIAVQEAEAKRDAAKSLAAAEVERAKGVAQANRITDRRLRADRGEPADPRSGPAPVRLAVLAIAGWFYLWSHYPDHVPRSFGVVDSSLGLPWSGVQDSFALSLPTPTTATFEFRVGGQSFPFPAIRDTLLPPWGSGRWGKQHWDGDTIAAKPGIAWRTIYYGDTLAFWGYSTAGAIYNYVGHCQFRTRRVVPCDPESTWTIFGYWTAR